MAKKLGTGVALFVAGKKIANLTSNDFDISTDMIEVTNKDSAGYKEFLPGENGGTMSAECRINTVGLASNLVSIQTLMGYQVAGTLVALRMTDFVSGELALEGNAYITNVKGNYPNNDVATATVSFQLTGSFSVATES